MKSHFLSFLMFIYLASFILAASKNFLNKAKTRPPRPSNEKNSNTTAANSNAKSTNTTATPSNGVTITTFGVFTRKFDLENCKDLLLEHHQLSYTCKDKQGSFKTKRKWDLSQNLVLNFVLTTDSLREIKHVSFLDSQKPILVQDLAQKLPTGSRPYQVAERISIIKDYCPFPFSFKPGSKSDKLIVLIKCFVESGDSLKIITFEFPLGDYAITDEGELNYIY